MKKWLSQILLVFATILFASASALAQDKEWKETKASKDAKGMDCRDSWNSDRLVNHCEIREQTTPATGAITVDAGKNGGISVKGADRNDVLVRARIQTAAPTETEAVGLAKQVIIQTDGARISAQGPDERRDFYWSVSYEIFVPRRTDLSLEAHNGGISIVDVHGKIDFNGVNGGVVLKRVGGNVHGQTTNGGVVVELSGDRWDGDTLDVRTTNGGVTMSVPDNYSAHLETGTVNGHVSVDFPVTVQGRITKELSVNLGSGGATVRAMTTNGGVKLRRSGAN